MADNQQKLTRIGVFYDGNYPAFKVHEFRARAAVR